MTYEVGKPIPIKNLVSPKTFGPSPTLNERNPVSLRVGTRKLTGRKIFGLRRPHSFSVDSTGDTGEPASPGALDYKDR